MSCSRAGCGKEENEGCHFKPWECPCCHQQLKYCSDECKVRWHCARSLAVDAQSLTLSQSICCNTVHWMQTHCAQDTCHLVIMCSCHHPALEPSSAPQLRLNHSWRTSPLDHHQLLTHQHVVNSAGPHGCAWINPNLLAQASCGSHAACIVKELNELDRSNTRHRPRARELLVHLLSAPDGNLIHDAMLGIFNWSRFNSETGMPGSEAVAWLNAGLLEALVTFKGTPVTCATHCLEPDMTMMLQSTRTRNACLLTLTAVCMYDAP